MRFLSTTRSRLACLPLALLALSAGACDDSPTGTEQDSTKLSVYLKDAPGDVDAVWLQIDDVVLMGESGKVSVLAEPTELIEVSALVDEATALVEGADVPAAHYTEVRLVLGGAVLQSGDGVYVTAGMDPPEGMTANGSLQCPSCSQSGIKVKLADGFTLGEGENGFLMDFDITQSFGHQTGQPGKWVMHPVVHGSVATPDDIEDGSATAAITGTVALATDDTGAPLELPVCGGEQRTLADFVPTATASTLVDDEGAPLFFTGATAAGDDGYTFGIGVMEGDTYALGYAAETVFDDEMIVWTATVEPATVAIAAAGDTATGVAYTVTGATCSEVTPP